MSTSIVWSCPTSGHSSSPLWYIRLAALSSIRIPSCSIGSKYVRIIGLVRYRPQHNVEAMSLSEICDGSNTSVLPSITWDSSWRWNVTQKFLSESRNFFQLNGVEHSFLVRCFKKSWSGSFWIKLGVRAPSNCLASAILSRSPVLRYIWPRIQLLMIQVSTSHSAGPCVKDARHIYISILLLPHSIA